MQATGIIANARVIPIDVTKNKFSIPFQFQVITDPTQTFNIPGVYFGLGSLAIFNTRNVNKSGVAVPPIMNLQGDIQWNNTTGAGLFAVGPLLIFVPSTGELVSIQPIEPTGPGSSGLPWYHTSFSVPLLPTEEIWLLKTQDQGGSEPVAYNINLIASTFERQPYRQGV